MHQKSYATPLVPVYDIFALQNPALRCYFPTTLQLHNLPGDCVRELLKTSKDAASFLDCNEKNWEVLDFGFLWVMS